MEIRKAWLIKIYDYSTDKLKRKILITNKEDMKRTFAYYAEHRDYFTIKKVKQIISD